MAVCRFIDTVDGMSLVVKAGQSLFSNSCCLKHGLGPARRMAKTGGINAHW